MPLIDAACVCGGVHGYGRGTGKTRAKKKAADMVLLRLLRAAGIPAEDLDPCFTRDKIWCPAGRQSVVHLQKNLLRGGGEGSEGFQVNSKAPAICGKWQGATMRIMKGRILTQFQ